MDFPLFSKIEVNGDDAHPLYKFLKSEKGGLLGDSIKWNFTKFLVDKKGKVDRALRADHTASVNRAADREAAGQVNCFVTTEARRTRREIKEFILLRALRASVVNPPLHFPLYWWLSRMVVSSQQKTFYIETFGCQMNFHDSEKVVGTLISEGYAQVQREEDADLIVYNTCSIRDKAEQKVFHRLNDFKKLHKEGKRFAVLGCVAQQEGEKIFERAPYVSLVAGSASYRNLPAMLVQIESWRRSRHRTR